MEALAPFMNVKGVDIDCRNVNKCKNRGLDALVTDASHLPYEDGSFDMVYCSFLLLWVKDPLEVLKEMKRVSRGSVVCLAEPDYGGRSKLSSRYRLP